MSRRARLAVERMEDRALPATFGVAWPDSTHLTLSFAPDGTDVTGQASDLFAALDSQIPRSVWQRSLLAAVQTWTAAANINIEITADGGQEFGAAGMGQGDPRFGDIRVGAKRMTEEALAVAVPHDPFLGGTWSGDVVFNTAFTFANTQAGLYSIALHEFGHVLGLGHSDNPASAMYERGDVAHTGITADDVAAIQALYGAHRPDANEGLAGNNTPSTATRLSAGSGSIPAVAYGDVSTLGDIDVYSIRPPMNYTGPMTFRLQSAGVSLLAPRLSVVDWHGNVLGSATSANAFGDTVTVTLNAVNPSRTYFLRVDGATADAFGIGRYAVAAVVNGRTAATPANLEKVMRGSYEHLSQFDLGRLLVPPPPGGPDGPGGHGGPDGPGGHGGHGGPDVPRNLPPSPPSRLLTHFAVTGALTTTTEIDAYTFRADFQAGAARDMAATVASLDEDGTAPQLRLFNSTGGELPVTVLLNGNGTYTVQATGLLPTETYEVRVAGTVGNYGLTIDLGGRAASVEDYSTGQLEVGRSATQSLYVAQPQLFQLVLTAAATGPGAGGSVRMTITDEFGRVVLTLSARTGESVSGLALLLAPGEYRFRYVSEGPTGSSPLTFSVRGEVLSDPIGPALTDTTMLPRYYNPNDSHTFLYPGNIVSYLPFHWAELLYEI